MLDFLPDGINRCVQHVNLNRLYELRIRAGKPLYANFGGKYCMLGENGIVKHESAAYFPSGEEVEETVFAASGYSVYAVENQIRQGFIVGNCGERIGLAGSYVYEKNSVLAVRSFTSLCIRIPHEIVGCADRIYRACLQNGLQSVLVMSPPGVGKTTILRDLSRLVSKNYRCNVLVSDERGELSAGNLGETSDCILFADKATAFTAGIRALRPDLIVTDELLTEDYEAVRRAVEGGVKVFASAHLTRYEQVPQKLFSYYAVLNGLGMIGSILNGEGHELVEADS